MESIEAIKSFMSLVLQLANFAATRNEQVQTPETTPSNQHAKLSTLYSIVGNTVEKSRNVIQKQRDAGARKSKRTKNTAAKHHLPIQPSSGAVEDAATWLYRLVFLPAAQYPSPSSDRDIVTDDTSVTTSPVALPYLTPRNHPESGSNGNAPSTSNAPINMELLSTTYDTQHVINGLLQRWTSLNPIPPALNTPAGNDDFQIQVRKGIEEYNSQDFQSRVPKKRKKARKAPQLQSVSRALTASSSLETLRRDEDIGNQAFQPQTENQGVPVDHTPWQTGRAMTVSSTANTDSLPRPQGVVISPESQDGSSTFSGFTGPSIGRRSPYSQPGSGSFSTRNNSLISTAPNPGRIQLGDTNIESQRNRSTIAIQGPHSNMNIDNAHLIDPGALINIMEAFSKQSNRDEENSNGGINTPKSDDMKGGRRRLWERVGAVVSGIKKEK
jgi:hypothetical protein